MRKLLAILLAALMALTMAMPAMAAGYSVDPAIEQVPVEQKDPASGNISGEISQTIGSGSTGNVEINVNASAAGTENALPTASVAISKDSFRKIAKSGKDLVVNVTAPAAEGEESGKVVATYTVTSAQAAKIRKAVRLSTKTLSDAVIAKVKEACGENYLISAFKSTKLFGNMLVRSTVKVTLYTNASLKEIITSGKSQLIAVYKINEKTGKLTKVNAAVNSTLKFAEDGSAISFDINRGDSYAVGVVGNTDIDFTVVETTVAPVEETIVPAAAEETTAAAAEETTAAAAVTTAAPSVSPEQQKDIDAINTAFNAYMSLYDNESTEPSSDDDEPLMFMCGFSAEFTEERFKEMMLELLGLDSGEYSVTFPESSDESKTFNTLKASYAAEGNLGYGGNRVAQLDSAGNPVIDPETGAEIGIDVGLLFNITGPNGGTVKFDHCVAVQKNIVECSLKKYIYEDLRGNEFWNGDTDAQITLTENFKVGTLTVEAIEKIVADKFTFNSHPESGMEEITMEVNLVPYEGDIDNFVSEFNKLKAGQSINLFDINEDFGIQIQVNCKGDDFLATVETGEEAGCGVNLIFTAVE